MSAGEREAVSSAGTSGVSQCREKENLITDHRLQLTSEQRRQIMEGLSRRKEEQDKERAELEAEKQQCEALGTVPENIELLQKLSLGIGAPEDDALFTMLLAPAMYAHMASLTVCFLKPVSCLLLITLGCNQHRFSPCHWSRQQTLFGVPCFDARFQESCD